MPPTQDDDRGRTLTRRGKVSQTGSLSDTAIVQDAPHRVRAKSGTGPWGDSPRACKGGRAGLSSRRFLSFSRAATAPADAVRPFVLVALFGSPVPTCPPRRAYCPWPGCGCPASPDITHQPCRGSAVDCSPFARSRAPGPCLLSWAPPLLLLIRHALGWHKGRVRGLVCAELRPPLISSGAARLL